MPDPPRDPPADDPPRTLVRAPAVPRPVRLPPVNLTRPAASPFPALKYVETLRSWNSQRTALLSLRRALTVLAPGHEFPKRERGADWQTDPVLRVPWHYLSAVHLQAMTAALERAGSSPPTVELTWYHVRAVLRTAWRMGIYSEASKKRLDSIPTPRRKRVRPAQWLGLIERQRLWTSCDPETPQGARDRMFLALADVHMLRRSECVGLTLEDFAPLEDRRMRVLRKGGDVDVVTLTAQTFRVLERWLVVRGDWPGPLLCPISQRGHVIARRMSPDSLFRILRKKVDALGIQRVSPHDLRAGGITDLIGGGVDIAMVSRLAGHSSIQTTERYDRRGDAQLATAGATRTIPVDVD